MGLQEECRDQPGNASVPVTERMDAQEIKHEGGNNQKWRDSFIVAGFAVVPAKRIDGSRSVHGGRGKKPDTPLVAPPRCGRQGDVEKTT